MIYSSVCDIEEFVQRVLLDGTPQIKYFFKIDVESFTWVKDFVRDQEARAKIETLTKSIDATNKMLIHRDELKRRFLNQVDSINEFRVSQMVEHLKNVQAHQDIIINEMLLDGRKFSGAFMHLNMIHFSEEMLESMFSQLPEGTRQEEKQKIIDAAQAEINRLRNLLETDLNHPGRWVYSKMGKPILYPTGCRWLAYVEIWKRISPRFSGPVDIEGYAIDNPNEMEAYTMLKIGAINKIMPTQAPRDKKYPSRLKW